MTRIRPAETDDRPRWDEFVKSMPGAGPYHTFGWKTAVERAYGHGTVYLIAEDDERRIRGGLPLVEIKPPLLGGSLVSLPFCDYGGLLANDYSVRHELVLHAIELAKECRRSIEIRCSMRQVDLTGFIGLNSLHNKARMVLDLPESSEVLWKSFKSKLRSQIKKPIKESLSCRIDSIGLIDDFYGVFAKNMRRLGSPVHSKNWVRSVVAEFGDHAHVGVIYKDRMPVGGGIILCFNDTVSIPWASTLIEYNRLSPNMLLYWEFLKFACDHGYKVFDFGRSTVGEGTYRFKEQWGARPHPLYWYTQRNVTSDSRLPGRYRIKLVEKTWAALPGIVTNILGPVIRRYISL